VIRFPGFYAAGQQNEEPCKRTHTPSSLPP
jgi:hypothetical protein